MQTPPYKDEDENFIDSFFGKYTKRTNEVNGTLVVDCKSIFSINLADATFAFSNKMVAEIKSYLAQQGYNDIKHVYCFTALATTLQREQTKMRSETRLMLIKEYDGGYSAIFFTGCNIEDNSSGLTI